MFLLLVTVFSMVFFVNAQQIEEVEEVENAETGGVILGNEAEENAEIDEIDAAEKAKEVNADANIEDNDAKSVEKEVAEDAAAGKEEAEIISEDVEEIHPLLKTSSSDDSVSVAKITTPAVETAPEEPKIEHSSADNKEKSSILRTALLYFPNVLMDLSDIVSVGVGAGAESGFEVRITRWCQIGGLYGDTYFVEKGFDRRFGGGYEEGYNFQLVALSSEKRYRDPTFGSVKEFICKQSKARVQSPSAPLYKDKDRDFWAIGAEGGWLVKVRVDFHPVEFADFLATLFFLDITGDNLK